MWPHSDGGESLREIDRPACAGRLWRGRKQSASCGRRGVRHAAARWPTAGAECAFAPLMPMLCFYLTVWAGVGGGDGSIRGDLRRERGRRSISTSSSIYNAFTPLPMNAEALQRCQ